MRSAPLRDALTKIYDIDELTAGQGDVALIIEEAADTPGQFSIIFYTLCDSSASDSNNLTFTYTSACDLSLTKFNLANHFAYYSDTFSYPNTPFVTVSELDANYADAQVDTFTSRKYKPVAKKVHPVLAELPDKYRITRNIMGDPLAKMPTLNPNPPDFTPMGRYTKEQRDIIDKVHSDDFLLPEERKLMHHFMSVQNLGFAWEDSKCGRFREDFFPPIMMPVIEHKPWVLCNMPIPPGIYDKVCRLIKVKIAAGVYE